MLAIKTKAPIVPVWIKKKPKIFVLNTLKFGQPFTLDEFYDKKLDKENLDKISKLLTEKILQNK